MRLLVGGNGAKSRAVVTAQYGAGVRSALPQLRRHNQNCSSITHPKDVAFLSLFLLQAYHSAVLMPSSMSEPAVAAVALPTRPVRTVIRHSTIWSPSQADQRCERCAVSL